MTQTVDAIEHLLGEDNSDAHMYNTVWNAMSQPLPVSCADGVGSADLALLLQKTVSGLDIYSKVCVAHE